MVSTECRSFVLPVPRSAQTLDWLWGRYELSPLSPTFPLARHEHTEAFKWMWNRLCLQHIWIQQDFSANLGKQIFYLPFLPAYYWFNSGLSLSLIYFYSMCTNFFCCCWNCWHECGETLKMSLLVVRLQITHKDRIYKINKLNKKKRLCQIYLLYFLSCNQHFPFVM